MENSEIKSEVFVMPGIKIEDEEIDIEEEKFWPEEKFSNDGNYHCSFSEEKFQLSKENDGQMARMPNVEQQKLQGEMCSSTANEEFSDASSDEFCLSEDVIFKEDSIESDREVKSECKLQEHSEEDDIKEEADPEERQTVWIPITNFDNPSDNATHLDSAGFTVPVNTGFQCDVNISKPKEPIEWFQLFFTDELLKHMADETNSYAKKNCNTRSVWKEFNDVTVEELKAFIGLVINIGMIRLHELSDYWSKNPRREIPFFSRIMSKRRFFEIFWMMRVEKQTAADERKVGNQVPYFIDYLNEQSKNYFTSYEKVAIDKNVVKFRGNFEHISYTPSNYFVKCFTLTDSKTGYVYYAIPYYGSNTDDTFSLPECETVHMSDYLQNNSSGKGYTAFTDKYYSIPTLTSDLLEIKFEHKLHNRTILLNKVKCSEMIKKYKGMKYQGVIAYKLDDNVIVINYKDNQIFSVFVTKYNIGYERISHVLGRNPAEAIETVRQKAFHKSQNRNRGKGRGKKGFGPVDGERKAAGKLEVLNKPIAICHYTKYLGSVDRVHHDCCLHNFEIKTLKWWRRMFFWMLEVAVINSFTLCKLEKQDSKEKKNAKMYFRDRLVCQLVGNVRNETIATVISTSAVEKVHRLDGKFHAMGKEEYKKYRDCKVCSNRTHRGPEIGRKKTKFFCVTCNEKPYMCADQCFKKYHTAINL